MFCPFCGAQLNDDAVFCGSCGGQIEAKPKPRKKASTPAKTIITKQNMITAGLFLLLAAIYAGITLILTQVLKMEQTITVKTLFDSEVCGYMTLQQFFALLKEGNSIYYPTTVSLAYAVGFQIFLYAVPVSCGVALLGMILTKNNRSLRTLANVISGLAAALLATVVPVSLLLSPGLKNAVAMKTGVIFEDIDKITYTPMLLLAGGIVVLIVAGGIVSGILNRRRSHK